jgi:hypothetical protein
MEIHKVDGKQIYAGRSWTNSSGTQHPKTWQRWSADEKTAAGIATVVLQELPDQRLYTSSHNADGSVASTPRELDDVGEGIAKVLGVRSDLIAEVKSHQASMLAQTDWAIIRRADTKIDVPTNIQKLRDEIRLAAAAMEDQITQAADIDAIAALFITYHEDGNRSGTLYEWPELVR